MNIHLNLKSLLFPILLTGASLATTAQEVEIRKGLPIPVNNDVEQQFARAEACAPATAIRDLEWNNVRALIENGGTLWYDRAIDRGAHYVPKELNVSVCYGGALWLGGISPDQQLKLAAVKYRWTGNDFWPGPLTNDGSAEVSAQTCAEYDHFVVSHRNDAIRHRQYFDALAEGTESELDGYVIPSYFRDYPAHGNTALNQDYYLAPFYDYDGDGAYNPDNGDYPWYDFLQEIDCGERRREDVVPLYGDQNFFWIFNDKGNVHSESQGEPIGMEVRAQAFAFSTNDEVNNMTFYNYVLINQGTQTLTETYFAQWVDSDLGGHVDDYVGCDVQRGLGYSYNGDAYDDPSSYSLGYGANPPAMGVDFFEGPYQDADGIDNPLTTNFSDAIDSLGIPYEGIGIGYGDGVIDNERYGMRKFLYYNWNYGTNGQPTTALQYYNYMQGFWKNGQRMSAGGDGFSLASGSNLDIPSDYLFPGDTDPNNWGTNGIQIDEWSEYGENNPAGDRLFLQSAGPFTLEPGDYNNITVGMLYARAYGGEAFDSVKLLRIADDKAQALFDNCFEIVSGPDAPDVAIQELENELILFISNDNPLSNNFHEEYEAIDPSIPKELEDGTQLTESDRSYKFQGYQIYQLIDNSISAAELDDPEKARLIFQCDVEDDVEHVVNYYYNEEFEISQPVAEAVGANEGVQHSFRITTDAFAQGDNALVNHRTYYFMAIAYGYNNYRDFNSESGTGQDVQYKASRKSATGSIRVYSGVPHVPSPESEGTIQNANYGDGVVVTRHEGRGTGTNDVDISAESEAILLSNGTGRIQELVYAQNGSPVDIRVVDPLMVPDAEFELIINPEDANLEEGEEVTWTLINKTLQEANEDSLKVYRHSNKTINILNEQLILDWGISITIHQHQYTGGGSFTDPVAATIEFDNPSAPWFTGVPDSEGFDYLNWIRAGTQEGDEDIEEEVLYNDYDPGNFKDEDEVYEGILGGTWAPYSLVSFTDEITPTGATESVLIPSIAPTIESLSGELSAFSGISGLNNVDVVLTSDKSLWTRCPVLEMQPVEALCQQIYDDNPAKMSLRRHPSVDKNGRKPGDDGYKQSEANPSGNQPVGMSWFPGYAIDIGTGERLNIAFGEDSWLSADNGDDMIFNPSHRIYSDGIGGIYAGGQHWIYIFKNASHEEGSANRMPAYDNGDYLYDNLEENASTTNIRRVFRACTWVGSSLTNKDYPMLSVEDGLVPNDCRIRLRVAKQYAKYSPSVNDVDATEGSQNNWNPLYTFSTKNVATGTQSDSTLTNVLDIINIVPNPYYAYSKYETNKLDNRVKITNLPEECTVSIYNLSGTLIRQYDKADPTTSLDWDLKNHKNVPIAGGVYIIHVDVPGIGQTILKWFGVMRPIDLDNF